MAPALDECSPPRLSLEPHDREVVVRVSGVEVARSRRVLRLVERGLPPVFYFPVADVRVDLLQGSETRTRCPCKGEAAHYHLAVGGRRLEDVAWSYEVLRPQVRALRGRIAFYAHRVDSVEEYRAA